MMTLVVSKCFGELCTPLKHIFDLSFERGIFPDSLKIAKITPVYKSGGSSSLSNYRPISVLPRFSEMLECMMYTQLCNYRKIKYFILNNSIFKQGTPVVMLLSN